MSSITINTGKQSFSAEFFFRYAMIHMAFFIFLLILLSIIYHIMLLAICTTQVKKRVKKKKKTKEGHDKLASRGFEPGFCEFVRTENAYLYPLDNLGKR